MMVLSAELDKKGYEFEAAFRCRVKFDRNDIQLALNNQLVFMSTLGHTVDLEAGDVLTITDPNLDDSGLDSSKVSLVVTPLAPRAESGGGERLVDESYDEPSMYDRLRMEMLAMFSAQAEAAELEDFEEFNDLDLDEDDEELILTPYEYQEMKEEFPMEAVDVVEVDEANAGKASESTVADAEIVSDDNTQPASQ